MVMGMLGNLRRAVVADVRRQRGDQHQRTFQQSLDPRRVDLDSRHAVPAETVHRVGQQAHAVKRIEHDQWLVF